MNTKIAIRAYPRTLWEGASGRESWHFHTVLGRALNTTRSSCWLAALLVWTLFFFCTDVAIAATTEQLFDAPRPTADADEILLISTRAVGTACSSMRMSRGLRCERYTVGPTGSLEWRTSDWRRLLSAEDDRPTIFYVHGNRVAPGQDGLQGLQVYESLKKHGQVSGPIRFVIWSWPATPISRPVKDYRVKAQRTTPVAWQLAWLLDKLPVENSVSLVGYSYGTRVVSGAAHLLAGGNLGGLRLTDRHSPRSPPVRMALIAAAYDADWIQPKNVYGRSIAQIQRLVLATNELDPAMRFYHLSNGRGKMHALGKSGVHRPKTLGTSAGRLHLVDFTNGVGRSHSLANYLAAEDKMKTLWRQLMGPQRQTSLESSARRSSPAIDDAEVATIKK